MYGVMGILFLVRLADRVPCDGKSVFGHSQTDLGDMLPCDGRSISGQTHKQTWVTWYRVMGSLFLVNLKTDQVILEPAIIWA